MGANPCPDFFAFVSGFVSGSFTKRCENITISCENMTRYMARFVRIYDIFAYLRTFVLVEAAGIEPVLTYSKYVLFVMPFQVSFQVNFPRPLFSGTFRNICYS